MIKSGLDVFLEKNVNDYKGKRLGLVTNMTGVSRRLISGIDLFYEHPDIHITALYGPEHGIRGMAKEGEKVSTEIDPYTGLPVYSLYGDTRKPTREMLEQVDAVVFDLQDIGARYYTYIYTMAYVMQACAEQGLPFIVLDRPNPISGSVMEGNLVSEDTRSFVGMYPIPNRHGMTIGELACFFNHECNIHCDLDVIRMEGWERSLYFDETGLPWVPPSPNVTGMDMAVLYPGTCLVEGTNLSEARGTTRPFEWIGAPFMDGHRLARAFNNHRLPGVWARPVSFVPAYQKYKDEVCEGVQLHVTDRHAVQSVRTGLTLLETAAGMYPESFQFIQQGSKYFFDLLAGTKLLRSRIQLGRTEEFLEGCGEELEMFVKRRKPYLLY